MSHFLFTGILCVITFISDAQVNKHGSPCGGMDILDVGIHIKGQKVLEYKGIRYSEICVDSLQAGFTVEIIDTSYRLTWFLINYDSSGYSREFPISGTNVNRSNAAFLKSISPGDVISLDCINIEKIGDTSLSTGFLILVTK